MNRAAQGLFDLLRVAREVIVGVGGPRNTDGTSLIRSTDGTKTVRAVVDEQWQAGQAVAFFDEASRKWVGISSVPPRVERESTLINERSRPPQTQNPVSTGPWWEVDYYMNVAIYQVDEDGYWIWSTWYPGMHLGLRHPGKRNIIVFRDGGTLPDESDWPASWDGEFSWLLMYAWYRQYNNAIDVDSRGVPHTLTAHQPPYRRYQSEAWIWTYDWNLYENGWWAVASHGKTMQAFKVPHRLSAYTQYQRVCNDWVWSFPTELAIPGISSGPVSEKGHTYSLRQVQSAADIHYFSVETPVNDNILTAIDGVIMGEFEYSGNVLLFPGGPSVPFSVQHKGERGNLIVWDLDAAQIPASYDNRGSVGKTAALPENLLSEGYIPGTDGSGNPIPLSTPDNLNTEIGGGVYRIRFSLAGSGISDPQSITINGQSQLIESAARPASSFLTYDIRLSMTDLPAYAPFKPGGVPVDNGLIGRLRFAYAKFSGKEEADPSGHPGYVDVIFRDLDLQLGLGETPQGYVDSIESVTITGFSPIAALYTESNGQANYTLPMLVDLPGEQYLAEAYNGSLRHRANTWHPYSGNEAQSSPERFWIERGTSETYLIRDGQKIICDGTPQVYIPIPPQSSTTPPEVGENLTISFSATIPDSGYDGSGEPVLLCYTEGWDVGYRMRSGAWPTLSRNTPRPESAALLEDKLAPGATVYGAQYVASNSYYGRIYPFKGEIVSCQWRWAPLGTPVPDDPRLWKTGMQGRAVFLISELVIKLTTIIQRNPYTSGDKAWRYFGDEFPPYTYIQNTPSTSNPLVPAYRQNHGYLFLDGSFRNIYLSGGYTAGQMLHGVNMKLGNMVEGPLYHHYWGQKFLWQGDYIWRISREIDTTALRSLSRDAREDAQGNVLIPAQEGYFIPRWKIDLTGDVGRCVFDDFQVIDWNKYPEYPEFGLSIGTGNTSLDPKMLLDITKAETDITPP